MKTNKSLVVLTVLCTAVMVGLVVRYYHTLLDTPAATPITTAPISKSQGIGGVASEAPQTTNSPNEVQAAQNTLPTSPRTAPATPSSVDMRASPRQEEITKKVTEEFPYKALQTPNDPYYTNPTYPAWALTRTQAEAAWSQTTGSATPVVIAVIDTGFALQHEDLSTQWYTNTAETGSTKVGDRCWTGTAINKQSNNCDDDNNGYIDD
ncbi:MAG: hypothetical protein WAQ25_05025 [Candidatus Saccharimonas sp.]